LEQNVLTSQINSLLAKHSFSIDQKVSDGGQEERRAKYFKTEALKIIVILTVKDCNC